MWLLQRLHWLKMLHEAPHAAWKLRRSQCQIYGLIGWRDAKLCRTCTMKWM